MSILSYALFADPTPDALIGDAGPEGVRQYREKEALVTVAWWTNARGRRWLRVTREDATTPLLGNVHGIRHRGDPRPPLWHVAPWRVFLVRTSDGDYGTLTACACGEVGTPEATLWMGDRCGACHDRAEEGDAGAPAQVPAVTTFPAAVDALTFAGREHVVVAAGHELYRLRTTDDVTERLWSGRRGANEDHFRAMSASDDGRYVAAAHADGRTVRVFDTDTGRNDALPSPWPTPSDVVRPLLSSAGDELVLPNAVGPSTHAVRREDGWDLSPESWSTARAMCREPGGGYIISRSAWLLGFLGSSPPLNFMLPDEFLHMRFVGATPEGRIVCLAESARNALLHTCTLRPGRTRPILATADLPNLAAPALTPCGTYVAGLIDGTLVFYRTDDLAFAGSIGTKGEFRRDGLAFSPDGRTCAAISNGGSAVLFPWRDLLEAGGRR